MSDSETQQSVDPPLSDNIKILTTKNQLLQNVNDTIAGLISKLDYKNPAAGEVYTKLKTDDPKNVNIKNSITQALTELRINGTTNQTLREKTAAITGKIKDNLKKTKGGDESLSDLLQKYQKKLFITSTECDALAKALTTFKTTFDTTLGNINKQLTQESTRKLSTLWNDTFNEVVPKDYIKTLFNKYNEARDDEINNKIKQDFPNVTEEEKIGKILEERIQDKGGLLKGNQKTPEEETQANGQSSEDSNPKGEKGEQQEGSSGEKGVPSNIGSVIGQGLMGGFNILYMIYGAIGAVLVIGTFFLSSVDILKFSVLEVWQYILLFINPNVFNKDTLDFSTLLYAKNSEKDEPYTIYLQQEFIKFMFQLVTYFAKTIGVQVALFLILKVLKALNKVDFDESLSFGAAKKAIIVMIITIATAFIQNTYYNTTFLNSLQPEMIASTADIRQMANTMYDNMTTHSEFLDNVVSENLTECIRIINSQGDRHQAIGSMIFTLSLYNFFKINVPSDSPAFNIVREVFTLKERRVRSINPVSYMYFQQNVFIPNLYAMIDPYISGATNVLNTKLKRDTVRKNVANRISILNRLLMGLFTVPSRRGSFRNYIYLGWILSFAFVVGIYSVYREEMDTIYVSVIKPFFSGLNEFFWNIVLPWDTRSSKKVD